MTFKESLNSTIDTIKESIVKPSIEFLQKNTVQLQAALYTSLLFIGIDTFLRETVNAETKIVGAIIGGVGLIGDIALLRKHRKNN